MSQFLGLIEFCVLAIFVCDWDMKAGTVLVSTSVPFESQDAEDRGAVSMGEVLGQILKDRAEHNAKHPGDPVPAVRALIVSCVFSG